MHRPALTSAALLLASAFLAAGCDQQPKINYLPLSQAGFSSETVSEFKKLKITDTEIPQLVKLKSLGLSDESSLELFKDSRAHQHSFTSGDAAGNLIAAGYSEPDILSMARTDQLDTISTEAITLKLIGLSEPTVQLLVSRHLQGEPTLSSAVIGRLKNTGLSEKQILELINGGMTDDAGEKEAASREAKRNHANTDFVRTRARRN